MRGQHRVVAVEAPILLDVLGLDAIEPAILLGVLRGADTCQAVDIVLCRRIGSGIGVPTFVMRLPPMLTVAPLTAVRLPLNVPWLIVACWT
jgi:hypothetical protein